VEKLKKGDRPPGKATKARAPKARAPKANARKAEAPRAKPSSKLTRAPKAGIAMMTSVIEAFSEKVMGLSALSLQRSVLKPSSPAAIALLEKRLRVTLPPDVKTFLERGLKSARGSVDEPFASMGFDFLDAKGILEHTEMLRKVAAESDDDDEHAAVIREGVALTYSEPELVWSGGALYHFSFRNPLLRVAKSLSEFLEHYVASGCFCSHDFRALWKVVGPHVPIAITPAKNVWLSAYKKQFPTFSARA